VARPTDDIAALRRFYIEGLGLRVLSEFSDHAGFDGLMLGHSDAPYHFEFTHSPSHRAGRAPTQDNLLVFYFPEKSDWTEAVTQMRRAGYSPATAFNPYWDRAGLTFEDPDGYRVVLQNAAWGTSP
jgi:catechol 2,3-dioxygenase-like lactoylglutathione lyase family enzyme